MSSRPDNKKPSGVVRGGFGFDQLVAEPWTYPSMRSHSTSAGWAIVAI
jgi:hypothetical protein